jgi:hypothetical protein
MLILNYFTEVICLEVSLRDKLKTYEAQNIILKAVFYHLSGGNMVVINLTMNPALEHTISTM